MDWKEVRTDADIQELLKTCLGFHDACIVSAQYVSGTHVAEDGAMWFGTGEEHRLLLLFHSQWEPHYIELYFEGVRRFRLIGFQDNHFNEVFEAFIRFYDGILPCEHFAPSRVIVWSDNEFSPESYNDGLQEPADTYVIASSLKWRIADGPEGGALLRDESQKAASAPGEEESPVRKASASGPCGEE